MRLQGHSYQDIAAAGGGIRSTVAATRADSAEQLAKKGTECTQRVCSIWVSRRLNANRAMVWNRPPSLSSYMCTDQLNDLQPVELIPTFLGAHMVPDEYQHDREAYIRLLCEVFNSGYW